ncbi:MAG TPA: T9SS type A sorting domain-containing protein [Saprospiraceae bacterium]|nr:T9SS type A sorting domain-containing protein [Saprospiraceae bacterium]
MKCLFFCLLTFYLSYLIAQKNDYNWTWSGYAVNDTVLSGNFLNFNNKVRKLTNVPVGIKIGQANASISDDDGNLLFYFNGCRIAGKDHKVIENGDSINYSNALKLIAGEDCLYGYTGHQNSMILEDPYVRNNFYILHHTWERMVVGGLNSVELTKLNYTYVDMNANNGKGMVTAKNILILQDTINSGYLQAVKHANGRDWWIVIIDANNEDDKTPDNKYYFYLLNETGINLHHIQSIGPVFHWNTSAGGSAKFSPDGNKYVFHSIKNGLWFFNFDRETGMFSNMDYYPIFKANWAIGLEWSANGRYLYTSAVDSLFQYDTWAEDIGSTETLVDVWDGTLDPFETHFGLMQRGPDCKIYMSSFSSTRSIHVINNPDEPFPFCNFVQRDMKLFSYTATISMPSFPNYRLDAAPVCDPGIVVSSKDIEDLPKIDLKVYPNPASDLFYVESSYKYQDVMVEIRDMNGKICWQGAHHKTMRFSVTDFSDGVYMVVLKKDGLVIGGEKLVVVKR